MRLNTKALSLTTGLVWGGAILLIATLKSLLSCSPQR